jgi:hypothetical protein
LDSKITLSKQLYLEVAAGDTTHAELVQKIADAFNQQLSQANISSILAKPSGQIIE